MEVEGSDLSSGPSADPVVRPAHVPWAAAGSTALRSFVPRAVAPCVAAPAVRKAGDGGAAAWLGAEPSEEQLDEIAVAGPPAFREPTTTE
eukprot:15480496-Alexandrium_andersonii.AAC.1